MSAPTGVLGPEIGRPYRVVLVGGKDSDMIAGYDEEDPAKSRADRANTAAEVLGITARYEVRKASDTGWGHSDGTSQA